MTNLELNSSFQLKIGHDGHLVIWNPFDLPPLSLQLFVMMLLLLF